jgi:VWFA-related protein
MSPRLHRTATITLALLALAAAAPAQTPAPFPTGPGDSFGESLDVDLVNVEVLATDGDGRPVLDLAESDFRIYEDGRPVALTHFSLVREPGAGAESGRSRAAGDGARIVVFLDDLHTLPASRSRVLRQIEDTLDRLLRPGDQVMVARYGGSIEVLLPLTRDREAIDRTLRAESERKITAGQLQASFGTDRALQTVRDLQRNTTAEATQGFQGSCLDIGAVARNHAAEEYNRVRQTLDALTGFVRSLAGFEGRKTLLHVSDGIPLMAGAEVYSYAISLCDGSGAAQGIDYAEDVTALGELQYHRWDPFSAKTEMLSFDTTADWQRLAAHANVHQVSFYALQAAGLQQGAATNLGTGVRTTAETARIGVQNPQESLSLISRETGGRALLGTNDFRSGIEDMVADTRTYYLLSFQPTNPGSGRIHRLRVEVDRPGVRVRHRLSYRSKSAHERVADGVLTTLLYERTENPLGLRVASGERRASPEGQGDPERVRLQVRLPPDSLTLLPEGELRRGLFTVFLAVRDAEGNMTPVRERPVPVQVPIGPPGEGSAEGGADDFVYEVEMPLRTGRTEVAVAVRDELAGTTSYVRHELVRGDG